MCGAARGALLADPAEWLDAVHPDDRERVAALASSAASGEAHDVEYRIHRLDGAVRWVRELAYPVRDPAGAVVRVSGVAEDVTERRALLDQLQQTQRLESIGLLAGGVAHDFNNLLTVISGNVELLLLDLDGQPDLAALATDIQRAGERAGWLTRQLLAFSRREVLEPRVLDLDAVVVDTEKMLRRLLGEDVEFETHLGASGAYLRADPGHLVQVLMNLAVNARDAMPRGGRLRISTGWCLAMARTPLDCPGSSRVATSSWWSRTAAAA
ncbi:MAG: PAS domain-containing protein [Deltaproteobacteria bacterium]|nr:PAS domain-containing protein [Deltaproteobacteria bacterium]